MLDISDLHMETILRCSLWRLTSELDNVYGRSYMFVFSLLPQAYAKISDNALKKANYSVKETKKSKLESLH